MITKLDRCLPDHELRLLAYSYNHDISKKIWDAVENHLRSCKRCWMVGKLERSRRQGDLLEDL